MRQFWRVLCAENSGKAAQLNQKCFILDLKTENPKYIQC